MSLIEKRALSILSTTATLWLLSACFSPYWPSPEEPLAKASATGEKIWVRTRHHQESWVQKEKVGESVVRDKNGNSLGTVEQFSNTRRTMHWSTWYPMQGDNQIEDEDFFLITSDTQALAEHRTFRANGRLMNLLGKGMMLGGVVGLFGGLFYPTDNSSLRTWAATSGMVVGSVGWVTASYGARRFDDSEHVVDRQRAKNDADRYNREMQQGQAQPTASITLGGRF